MMIVRRGTEFSYWHSF